MEKLERIKIKIHSWESIRKQVSIWRFKGKKIVFTNGCFDILHRGHIEYLSRSRDLGGILIVGLNSDLSVKRIKGRHRPINDEASRSLVLASLAVVDAVIMFDQDTPYDLIRHIEPDILVKGKDYEPEGIAGYDIVVATGGEIVTIELTPGYSTTSIEEKILHLHGK